ncbi:MAG: formyl transferase [Nocardiopsaceae bacterium]|nr:formyl transferase [Nocardiopsaceae bacterium]
MTDRFTLPSTDGPVDHVVLECSAGHHYRIPVESLSAGSAPPLLRVLFLVSAHGGLSQAVEVALTDLGHQVSVCVVDSGDAMVAAVAGHNPDLIVCPMLTTKIPEQIWSRHQCLVVHPGPVGDRGPSSIDWAIELDMPTWGVTVLEANDEFDAGPVWAAHSFARQSSTKSGLYRHEVRQAAVEAVVEAVSRIADGHSEPKPRSPLREHGRQRPLMRQETRQIDWSADPVAVVLRKIGAAEGRPGVLDCIGGTEFYLFGAHAELRLGGQPGQIIAQRNGAICRATVDGAVWITHMRQRGTAGRRFLKLPAAMALGRAGIAVDVRHLPARLGPPATDTYRDIAYHEADGVGYLHFDFYNGAMSTEQCGRLREAYRYARSRPTRVIVLTGGRDFFSTGIHLTVIEAAADPATESLRNLNAITDLVHDVITTDTHLVVSALCGDVAAGGVAFAMAADRVVARDGIVINPYYQHMGGLFGSEYWTYLFPRRLGAETTSRLTSAPFTPISTSHAIRIGMVDAIYGPAVDSFTAQLHAHARWLADPRRFDELLAAKCAGLDRDLQTKPLAHYRAYEMARSNHCFFGPDQRYHHARRQFAYKQSSKSSQQKADAKSLVVPEATV